MDNRSGVPLLAAVAMVAAAGVGAPIFVGSEEYQSRFYGSERTRYRRNLLGGSDGITHIDTPKPISKRKARRLRGKGRA